MPQLVVVSFQDKIYIMSQVVVASFLDYICVKFALNILFNMTK